MKRVCLNLICLLLFDLMVFAQKREAVDLGLPSGTLWANMNVGASVPEEYGDYYAWGEVTTKRYYGYYSNYKHYKTHYSKYNYLPFKSSVMDNRIVLEKKDDAATVNIGADWRMPTELEMQELLDTCTFRMSTLNGTRGYVVKNKSGEGDSIFLPCTGHIDYGNYRIYPSTTGYYWSSTLIGRDILAMDVDSIPKDAPRSSKCMFLGDGVPTLIYVDRRKGCAIRPVYVGKR